MYFYKQLKNKYFKKNNYCRGQIFPFLLVCILILLAAGTVAKKMGADVKAETYLANAADAGALAAGSGQADAFNQLVIRNDDYENMYNDFILFYESLHKWGVVYLDNGITATIEAVNSEAAAHAKVNSGHADCAVWFEFKDAADPMREAAKKARVASKNFGAFSIIAHYQHQFTNMYKYYQLTNYCDDRDFMDQQYDLSRKNAISYAYQNSGTTTHGAKNFYQWLNSEGFRSDTTGWDQPDSTTKYKWNWSVPECPGVSEMGVWVDLTLPKISFYHFKKTIKPFPDKNQLTVNALSCIGAGFNGDIVDPTTGSDPFKSYASKLLSNDLTAIANTLDSLANSSHNLYLATLGAVATCVAGAPPAPPAIDLWPGLHAQASSIEQTEKCLYDGLFGFAYNGSGWLSGPTLKTIENQIWTDVWYTDDDVNTWDSDSCPADISNFPMVIRMIKEPDFLTGSGEVWKIRCAARTYGRNVYNEKSKLCNDWDSVKWSIVDYHGKGDLGDKPLAPAEPTNNYYSEIFQTDDDKP